VYACFVAEIGDDCSVVTLRVCSLSIYWTSDIPHPIFRLTCSVCFNVVLVLWVGAMSACRPTRVDVHTGLYVSPRKGL